MATAIGLAVAIYFASSGLAKLLAPHSIGKLLLDAGIARPSASLISRLAACAEFAIAGGLVYGSSAASAAGIVVLGLFTTVLLIALGRGSDAPCGCLGDIGSGRVGVVPVVRNAVLASGIVASWGEAASLSPATAATAAGTAALLVIVPEGIQAVLDLRAARHQTVLEG